MRACVLLYYSFSFSFKKEREEKLIWIPQIKSLNRNQKGKFLPYSKISLPQNFCWISGSASSSLIMLFGKKNKIFSDIPPLSPEFESGHKELIPSKTMKRKSWGRVARPVAHLPHNKINTVFIFFGGYACPLAYANSSLNKGNLGAPTFLMSSRFYNFLPLEALIVFRQVCGSLMEPTYY